MRIKVAKSESMPCKTDAEIAQSSTMRPIGEIAAKLGLNVDNIEPYGHYKAKINPVEAFKLPQKQGRLILVTAINPTPAGEGKTTVTIGLADALRHIGKDSVIALREPSLGPVFGVKGGAAGGGYAQVLPMEDINLHFTGDFHAIGAANNLLAAMLDNHIYQGNELNIDPKRVLWRRVVDMNDRQLRNIIDGMGKPVDGVMRPDGFDITVASEVMAVFCLAKDISDLKERLGNILVAYAKDGSPVYAKDLKANGAMAALLKDAIKPNLVQTIEGTPAFVHGGPFANIAHGCNSVTATRLAKHLADYAVTEASDSDAELAMIEKACAEHGVEVSLTEVWGKGGAGGADLAHKVVNAIENQPNNFGFAYDVELSIKDKIRAIAQKVYGAEDVDFSEEASAEIASLEKLGLDKMPICMAKTQYSLSDNAKLLGCPEGFRITVRGITVSAGAGFIVALCGNMMKMPGLPKVPAAEKIDVDAEGVIHGLF